MLLMRPHALLVNPFPGYGLETTKIHIFYRHLSTRAWIIHFEFIMLKGKNPKLACRLYGATQMVSMANQSQNFFKKYTKLSLNRKTLWQTWTAGLLIA